MKAFINCLLMLSAIQAKAETIQWNPEQVRKVLAEAERDGQLENLRTMLTPQVIQTLENYDGGSEDFSQDGNPVAIAPALASAAAAGVAVAVVEYTWNKYVGNGSYGDHLIRPGQFDLPVASGTHLAQQMATFGYPVQTLVAPVGAVGPKPGFPTINPENPVSPCVCPTPLPSPVFPPERPAHNPAAMTPAAIVVAEATVGALAYKASEYLLNKYGNMTPNDGPMINPNYFDLNPALPQ